jgi:glycosyltransferase involved in cell wall biosynthesis
VNELGLADVVHFEGFREDLDSLLPALDGFVHPATAEGLGVAVLEASRAGLPVVAAAAGGVPEIVVPGETGWLVPPGDAEALGQALVQLLDDPDEARRRGAAARERVRTEFSVAAMVAGNLAVYRGLVPAPGQSGQGPA